MERKICIICRISKSVDEFNDEHVIPDSVNGYYHIKSVCRKCNCKLSKADNKITDHQFIKFERLELNVSGKSGSVSNPFSGTHTLKDDKLQKLRFEPNSEGQFEVRLIPKLPQELSQNFNIVIDGKDEHKSDSIIKKYLQRRGVSLDQVVIETTKSVTEHPWINTTMVIDTKDFKMGILKMLYEFAVDSIPDYFHDPTAVHLSSVLHECDFNNIYENVKFIGDGFNKESISGFSHFIDLESKNHYLILFDSPDIGLVGFAKIFNVFSTGIILSDKSGYINDSLIVGKNDLETRCFEKLSLSEIHKRIYSPLNYVFQYLLPPDQRAVQEFRDNEAQEGFCFYEENGMIPMFGSNGVIKYKSIDLKLSQPHLNRIHSGDTINEITTHIELNEQLYVKLLPINKMYQVIAVRTEEYRVGKI